jgi:hypothetical protein
LINLEVEVTKESAIPNGLQCSDRESLELTRRHSPSAAGVSSSAVADGNGMPGKGRSKSITRDLSDDKSTSMDDQQQQQLQHEVERRHRKEKER